MIKYGARGYGLYWYCLECIAMSVDEHHLTFELEHDAVILAHDLQMDTTVVEEIMLYMVNVGLFENAGGKITCLKMLKRLDQSMTSNPKFRKKLSTVRQSHDAVMISHDTVMREETRQDKTRRDKKRLEENRTSSPSASDPIPYSKIIDLYHESLPGLASVKVISKKRKAAIRQRHLGIMGKDVGQWGHYFRAVNNSKFLMGRIPGKDWVANFDFLITEKAAIGVLEGKYL